MPVNAPLRTGDIYLVKFHPSDGSELRKFRPAVIVSSTVSEIDARFALIAPFTSSVKNYNSNAELLVEKADGLQQTSVLLCWYLWTVDTDRLLEKIGHLEADDIQKMQEITQKLFVS